jgi:hypothetical protein
MLYRVRSPCSLSPKVLLPMFAHWFINTFSCCCATCALQCLGDWRVLDAADGIHARAWAYQLPAPQVCQRAHVSGMCSWQCWCGGHAHHQKYTWAVGLVSKLSLLYTCHLAHTRSAIGTCQYCDYSCPMGGCCDVRCFNSPHNWQLGWGTPLTTLSSATFPVGSFITIALPNQQVGEKCALTLYCICSWGSSMSACQKASNRTHTCVGVLRADHTCQHGDHQP